MNIQILKRFFLWCTIINAGLLMLSTLICMNAPDWLYSMHGNWFSIQKETLNVIMYSYLGLFKIFIYIFNIAPLIALYIVDRKN